MIKQIEKYKFEIIKILDNWRWQDFSTDFESNFGYYSFKDEIKNNFYGSQNDGTFLIDDKNEEHKKLAEKILLTHYLIYICNRLRDSHSIFRDGLPVISQIVDDYYNFEDENFEDFIIQHVKTTGEKKNCKHKLIAEGKEPFAPKNTAQDYYCIFRTLETLKNCNFSDYLKKNCINDLAESLYKLTYQGVARINSSDKGFIEVYHQFTKQYKINKMDKHRQKRLWCLVRDYLYHPVFKELFKIVIDEDEKKLFNKLRKQAYFLELPGDVRNNNDTFATHFWGSAYKNSSKFVREQFEKDKKRCTSKNKNDCWGGCYPHQFDITFNLVPRMCESDNCSMCPICEASKINKEQKMTNWEKLCHKINGKYCSFALYAAGIKHLCQGYKQCELLTAITSG